MKPAKDQTNDQLMLNLCNVCEALGETRAARGASQILGDLRSDLRAECKARLDEIPTLKATIAEWKTEQALLIARNEQLKEQAAKANGHLGNMTAREGYLRSIIDALLSSEFGSIDLFLKEYGKYLNQQARDRNG